MPLRRPDPAAETTEPFRILPAVGPENEHFWRGGADGRLHLLRCEACRAFVHPPAPVCGACLGRALAVEAVSGRAHLLTYTVNHHPWIPGFEPPYVVAIVELVEQTGLRLTTNLVGVEPADVRIGMALRVVFERRAGDVYLPLFEPDEAPDATARAEARG
ncbi:MAG: OB-fold domain-containing protein [Myxococcales bacterium]|nr:OB-fold domain-containing protein [Myxococcales bacterium]